ncbi:DUF4192 family protein [Amycolatopsis rubida]|uniref:DUF4192 family protein n=1 Tax=Amycolatopsis rubida TaxID=112413 RepID=A0ABX0C1M2_9PSEU|nr:MULTISPECIES: DUF4192 domain-containing protein [Amycolatopsis]MYW96248.1 DUF4192 family protein [Amycolatopsis rubida]NEC61239.1 DUF4192 family protein [Amycolatopsis rubida]OAP24232.1 hypothetical protein A4R44_05005 [Amycolatopsis sp. M39]
MDSSNATGRFLSSVPAVLGFYPEESLIIMYLKPADGGRHLVGLTMRLDLPVFAAAPEESSAQTAAPLRTQDSGDVMICVASDRTEPLQDNELPFRHEIDILTAAITSAGHNVRGIYFLPKFTEGARWHCYCGRPGCGGILPDPRASMGAVSAAASGYTVQPSRQSVQQLFTRASAADLETVGGATRRALERREDAPLPFADRLAAFDAAVAAAGEGQLPADHNRVADLIACFASPLFRDACVLPPSDPRPELQRLNLLLHLNRLAPPELRRQIGTALAVGYCLLGDYLHASMACASVQPRTAIAELVRTLVGSGVDPNALDDRFTSYFRSARDSAAQVHTVGAPTDRRPSLHRLVQDKVRQVASEHERQDDRALRTRLERIDRAVERAAFGLPEHDEDVAELVASMTAPPVCIAALVSPASGTVDADRVALFRLLQTVAPPDYAANVAGAIAVAELTTGDLVRARAAARSVDPLSLLSEAVLHGTLTSPAKVVGDLIADIALAERHRLECAAQA